MRIKALLVSVLAVFTICFGVFINNVNAAEDRANGIAVNPLGQYYVLGPMVEYERLLNNSHGLALGYSAISSSSPLNFKLSNSINDYVGYLKGSAIELTYRYHYAGEGFNGWSFGAGVNYVSMDYLSITRYVPKVEAVKFIKFGDSGFYGKGGLVIVHNGSLSKTVTEKGGTAVASAFLSQYDNVQPQISLAIGYSF